MEEVVLLVLLAYLHALNTLQDLTYRHLPCGCVDFPWMLDSIPQKCPLTSLYPFCLPFDQSFNFIVFALLMTWKSSPYLLWVLRHGNNELPLGNVSSSEYETKEYRHPSGLVLWIQFYFLFLLQFFSIGICVKTKTKTKSDIELYCSVNNPHKIACLFT